MAKPLSKDLGQASQVSVDLVDSISQLGLFYFSGSLTWVTGSDSQCQGELGWQLILSASVCSLSSSGSLSDSS